MRPTVKLSEICKFQNGFAFKSELFKPKGEPILRISNIQKDNISDEKLVFFDLNDYDNLDTYIVNPGELVIAMSGATTGKIAINNTNKKYYLNQRVGKFSFDNDITKEYCHYFLGTKVEENLNKAAGAAIQNLSSRQILDIEIPLPPLETQKAIVAKLDQIFAEFDQTKSEIQKNLDNTDELWKSVLNQAFQGNWEMKKLGEMCDVRDGTHDSPKYYDEGIPFITSKNLKEDGIDFDNVNYISKEDHINFSTRSKVEVGDILFAMIGTIGNPTIVKDKREFSIKNVALIKFGGAENILNTYVRYLLDSDFTINNLSANSRGGTQKFIALKDIRNFVIPVPPLSEQEKIVEHLDQASKEVKALKSQYQSQLDNLEELKKSVLEKAFRGEMG